MSRIAPRTDSGSRPSNAIVPSTIAPAEYPDWSAPVATKAAWIGWSPDSVFNASTVVTRWPSALIANTTSDDASEPSISTAAAPVSPVADPYFTENMPRRRSTLNSDSWG